MKWKSYPAYEASGVEWLGRIPAHWEIVAVKRKYSVQLGKMLQNVPESITDVRVPYIKAMHIHWGEVDVSDLPTMWASPEEIRQYGIRPGDLLVCEGGEAGRAGVVNSPPNVCIIQNAAHRVRGNGGNIRFLQYLLREVSSSGWFDVLCNRATIAHFTGDKFAELRVPIPKALDEQHAIAAFLDRETERIDKLITKKERQIELLQEKRAALISHVVTKGLNPDVKMKESGVEWLGEIPEHWEVKKLRYLGKAILGLTYKPSDIVNETQGTLVLRSSNIQNGSISFQDNVFVKTEVPEKLMTRIGDILICSRNGSRALIGKNAKILQCAVGKTFGAFMTVFRSKYSDYLYYVFNSQLFEYQSGIFLTSTINQLTVDNLYNFKVPLPALEEQIAIVAYLSCETDRLDKIIIKLQTSIEYLHEYRTALISAAVTGKIDVRQEVS